MQSELDPLERDMLLEAASITAGKTLKSISSLIGQSVSISSPQLVQTGIEHIADIMGDPTKATTVICVHIIGDAHGAVVLLVDPDDIEELLSTTNADLRLSALEEMTNIIAGSSLGSLSKFLSMLFLQSVPTSTTDMLRAVINDVVLSLGNNADKTLCLKINIRIGPKQILTPLYLLFDIDTTSAIIRSSKRILRIF
jgi:chemotaxis protein CheC